MNIDVTKDNVIINKDSEKAHENEYRITECEFVFDVFTNSFQVKRAIFTILSTGEMYEVDIINNKCDIPSEVLKHAYETVKLGVYGYNIGENDELLNRFSPSYAEFVVPTGSYEEGASSPEPITPSQYDLYSQALQEGLQEVDDKLDEVVETVDGKIEEVDTKLGEVDTKLEVVDGKIEDVDNAIERTNEAIERTNNLNLDVSDKVDGDVTVTLTKKDASTKSVVISDGTSLQFMWQGTSLGIKTDDMEEYVFVDLQGIQGIKGDTGEPFTIKKTYSSVAEMNADFNNMEYGDYVMIASSVEVEDNAKLYTRGESQWIFITDFSGATGIRGPVGATPNIQIGSVTSGSAPSVTRTGTDENPILNFVLQPGPQGEVGPTGLTGNGISSITKTGTSGLVDTYTITFTNGNTTTFDVTNGKGIDRIEKTATVGNIDTYTIYFNDNSTSTFEVANGEVTKEELQEEVDRLSMIYNLFPTTSDEDTEMTLEGTGEVKLKKIGLKGNTYQESTSGKNLFDKSTITTSAYLKEDGTLQTGTGAEYITSDFIPVQPNTTYYKTQTLSPRTKFYDANKQVLDNSTYQDISIGGNAGSFTTPSNAYYFRFTGNVNSTTGININLTMLNEGSTALPYEPYTGNQPSPSPDYPQDIQVVSGDNTIKVEGKNLFDGVFRQGNQHNNWNTSRIFSNKNDWKVNVGDKFTFSTNLDLTTFDYSFYIMQYPYLSVSSNTMLYTSNYQATNTFTINCEYEGYLGFTIRKKNESNLTPSDISNYWFQIEKGTTATTYEPYQGATYLISLGNIELCKIGDYQDYIYKNNGNWYKYGAIGKVVLNGSENWYNAGGNAPFGLNLDGALITIGDNILPLIYCDNFQKVTQSASWSSYESMVSTNNVSSATNVLRFRYTSISSIENFKIWLSTHNTTLYYVLATPTITEITDTTLIEQLDNLENAYSYDTQTNISQTNDDMPFILDVEAILSLKGVLN